MIFNFSAVLLALAAVSAAAPAPVSTLELVKREAGPSGTVISPAGQNPEIGGYTPYTEGDLIAFKYQKARTPETVTSSVNVSLVTYDGKVTFHANNVTLATFLTSPDEQDTIEATFRIPKLNVPYPGQTSWVAKLEVYEYQIGSLGVLPFLSAAPRLEINQAA